MKKRSILAVAIVMMFCLVACGSSNTSGKVGFGKTTETKDYIKKAIEASDRLGVPYICTPDGTILAEIILTDCYSEADFSNYATLEPRKICRSKSIAAVFALTDSGDLYYRDEKVAENVKDIVYATTNMNEEGRYITNDGKVHTITKEFGEMVIDTYEVDKTRVGLTGDIKSLCVDKHDFIFVNQEGVPMMVGNTDDYKNCDISDWNNIAVIANAKSMNENSYDSDDESRVKTSTIAGIKNDGTVVATGDYADEILSWGDLSYISMSDDIIAGLTKDGRIKLTGRAAEKYSNLSEIEGLTGIDGIKVYEDTLVAIGNDGTYYMYYIQRDDWKLDIISLEEGRLSEDKDEDSSSVYFKYTPDGKLYRLPYGQDEWEAYTVE